ncbi:hypothetical protein [Variovorax ginsengisoli]|uniref:Ribulose-5-phosphate 4-epimerase/Fuculose-1-phosphate aldolase n=1 Tax=Variovorax ginsengisoli TaxID=363844 RepID=A0ABT9S923_9BURK|nr:hypothetical protein [Variovorax ginsengisoli]MDP9900855.1 hypothetical protein [Variovorax ginsengisoli]
MAKQLLQGSTAALSLRIPGTDAMWFGAAHAETPQRRSWRALKADSSQAQLHAHVLGARDDVCAVASGGGTFARGLADFGGAMPGVFDEQVRHLGRMVPVPSRMAVDRALSLGGNALLVQGQPIVLGMTGARLALNAELFEKCAKAYLLAVAATANGQVRSLPWVVRYVANRRLMKDEHRACLRVRQGLLPEESKGY